MSLKTFNPATEDELFTYDTISDHEAASIVDAVAAAQPDWAARSFQERGACFRKLADLLEQRKHPCGTLITKEMGKTIREAEAEVEKCAFLCRHYAEHAERYLADEPVETDAHKSYVAYRPLGTLLAIMPWNFPFWQVLRNTRTMSPVPRSPSKKTCSKPAFRRMSFVCCLSMSPRSKP